MKTMLDLHDLSHLPMASIVLDVDQDPWIQGGDGQFHEVAAISAGLPAWGLTPEELNEKFGPCTIGWENSNA